MANTKCPARYKNLGLETFGNKKKVTDELLKQLCKNDEYLYQQIRVLLDLTDPESRKRFNPPTFEDEVKSFGYQEGTKNDTNCYKFNDGGRNVFLIDFDTSNDGAFRRGDIVYDRDETIVDYDKTGDAINIYVDKDGGHAKIAQVTGTKQERQLVKAAQTIEVTTPKTTTKSVSTTVATGNVELDSYCYGPYGGMAPNGWWYVGYDLNKNYSVAPEWWKAPYTEGIPSKCRAQTFVAQHTGWVTQVNLNLKTESNKIPASPFSCEIWETKDGKPYGGALARVEKSFAHTGGRIESFVFNTKVLITKGKKYAIVMRSPLSHRSATYRTVGWPRTCYTNYMKGSYFYGEAYSSSDNGKTWIEYNSSAYGVLKCTAATMPIAFGFELFVQPTKEEVTEEEVIEYVTTLKKTDPEYQMVDVPYAYYPKGNHYLYFNIPSTNPINYLSINNLTDAEKLNGQQIIFDVSYNGEDWNNNYHMSDTVDGTGSYDFTLIKPTFVSVRCNLYNTDETKTPELTDVEFVVDTEPSQKAYIRSLPYCPESETMLPACIWSEVNANYEKEDNTDVKIDIVREIESEELISIRKDTKEELWSYYKSYYPNANANDYTDEGFREAIQRDKGFIDYLKTLEPKVYVICALPVTDKKYYKYFDDIELSHYPAYPMVSCDKLMNEIVLSASDFYNIPKYNVARTEYTFNTGYDLSKDMVNILFQVPQTSSEGIQEGIIQNELVEGEDYRISGKNIIFKLNGTNFVKNVVKNSSNEVKCFKTLDGTHDLLDGKNLSAFSSNVSLTPYLGEVVKLVINLKDNTYSEHMHYDVDYNNKKISMKPSMMKDINTCELLFTYNPLWVKDLTSENFPLKMDLWTENFVAEKDKKTYDIRVSPRDNLREVVLYDEEETLVRKILEEDKDFVVDYINNKITFKRKLDEGTPITIRYTPNLTDTSLSMAYRMDRTNTYNQAYIYGNYFTTRT